MNNSKLIKKITLLNRFSPTNPIFDLPMTICKLKNLQLFLHHYVLKKLAQNFQKN